MLRERPNSQKTNIPFTDSSSDEPACNWSLPIHIWHKRRFRVAQEIDSKRTWYPDNLPYPKWVNIGHLGICRFQRLNCDAEVGTDVADRLAALNHICITENSWKNRTHNSLNIAYYRDCIAGCWSLQCEWYMPFCGTPRLTWLHGLLPGSLLSLAGHQPLDAFCNWW